MTDTITANRDHMNSLYGKSVLWIGNECAGWTVAQFVDAARAAKALGFDTICPKRGNGGILLASLEQITEEAAAVRAEGVGYLPFTYLYGPHLPVRGEAFPGETQVRAEAAVAIELAKASGGSIQLDIEAEYNGATQCAALLASLFLPEPITVSVSTWSDPALQNFNGVIAALAPAVNAWTPQRYTNWLANQPLPAEETCIQPGVDLSSEFGANDPVAISSGHATVFVWEYQTAEASPANQDLARRVTSRNVPEPAPTPAPAPTPTPAPAPSRTFVVKPWPQPGSSLSSIAEIEYGASTQANIDRIAEANHIAAPEYIIRAWETLIIP